MLFNSLTFLVFFALALLVYRLPLPWWCKKASLVLASYVFYASGNATYLALLLATTALDFSLALALDRASSPIARRALCGLSVCANLGVLVAVKYSGFLVENAVAVLAAAGVHVDAPPPGEAILPLGISFYTFESISYVVDVYRGRNRATRSLVDYALFISFFPHLVAGPVVRSYDFLPQCEQPREVGPDRLGWGVAMLVIGLFEKCVVADQLAIYADAVFSRVDAATSRDAWMAALAFSAQIFFDFAGYSTCAIGGALCFGFALTDNFRAPYASLGIGEFWRRWHVSLSTWLRDYVYIPLGGNRSGTRRGAANALATMLIGGLWHGAAWHYVAWGGAHGALLVVERFAPWPRAAVALLGARVGAVIAAAATYLIVVLAWVLFRADSLRDAARILAAMFRRSGDRAPLLPATALAVVVAVTVAMLAWQALVRSNSGEAVWSRLRWWHRSALLAALLVALALTPVDDRAFIYFRF